MRGMQWVPVYQGNLDGHLPHCECPNCKWNMIRMMSHWWLDGREQWINQIVEKSMANSRNSLEKLSPPQCLHTVNICRLHDFRQLLVERTEVLNQLVCQLGVIHDGLSAGGFWQGAAKHQTLASFDAHSGILGNHNVTEYNMMAQSEEGDTE